MAAKIFFDRKDLLIGSLIGAAIGPLCLPAMLASLTEMHNQQAPGTPFMIFGLVSSVYVVVRSFVDVCSDLIEWRATPGMLAKPLPVETPEAYESRNASKILFLMLETLALGGGAIAFFVFDPSRPALLPELGPAMFGQFAIAIGALTFYERNITLLYPFHFRNWLGLKADRAS